MAGSPNSPRQFKTKEGGADCPEPAAPRFTLAVCRAPRCALPPLSPSNLRRGDGEPSSAVENSRGPLRICGNPNPRYSRRVHIPEFDLVRLLRTVFLPKAGERVGVFIDLPNPAEVQNWKFLEQQNLTTQRI